MIGVGLSLTRGGGDVPRLLDGLADVALAYSPRRLLSSYSGAIESVRRSSDSATQDAQFSGDWYDSAAINSFLGGGSGFVASRYDQTGGGRHAVQATTGRQPGYVASGIGSRPTPQGDGVDDRLEVTLGYTLAQPYTVILLAQAFATNNRTMFDGVGSGGRARIGQGGAGSWAMNGGTNLSSSTTSDLLPHVLGAVFAGANSRLFLDGTQIVTGNAGAHSVTGFTIHSRWDALELSQAYIPEVIVLSGDRTADIPALSAAIRGAYGL